VPKARRADLIYFNVPETAHLLAFKSARSFSSGFRPLVASGLISVFKKIWAEFRGPKMEYVLRNTLPALHHRAAHLSFRYRISSKSKGELRGNW